MKEIAKEIRLRAYAKINTGLDVIRRREDGYHEVKMILQTVDIYDEIHIRQTQGEDGKISLSVNRHNLPTDDKNLIVKAAGCMADLYGIRQNLHINLEKRIPMAAGMAGGSADAAATLVGMNRMFALNQSEAKLQEIGLKLGADIPFCIVGGTYLAEGIGEKLTRLPDFPSAYIVVVKPKKGVSTKYVYENLNVAAITDHPDVDAVTDAIQRADLAVIGGKMSNILENVTLKQLPVIADVKEIMRKHHAIGSNMSGSGPSVFGLFEHEEDARACLSYFLANKETHALSDVFLTKTFEQGVVVLPDHQNDL